MREREDIVAGIVASAGGELVGKIRLQKITYLLDQLGLNSGFEYEYYHFGPFSRDVVNATEDAKAFGLLKEEVAHRASDGAPFSIFHSNAGPKDDAFGELGAEGAHGLIEMLRTRHPATLKVCTLLNKPERREVEVPIDYCGFVIPNKFVFGYGLDLDEYYRNLPFIATVDTTRYQG